MEKQYDVILVGAGPTGIFAAYELMLKAPNLKVLLFLITSLKLNLLLSMVALRQLL